MATIEEGHESEECGYCAGTSFVIIGDETDYDEDNCDCECHSEEVDVNKS